MNINMEENIKALRKLSIECYLFAYIMWVSTVLMYIYVIPHFIVLAVMGMCLFIICFCTVTIILTYTNYFQTHFDDKPPKKPKE